MTEKKYSVISYGELLWDMLPSGKLLGGAPSNFAFRLNNLGVPTLIVSRLGKGPLGQEAIRVLESAGISTDFIQTGAKHPTGIVEVEVDSKGQPEYVIAKSVAYDYILLEPKQIDVVNNSKIFCFGTLIQRGSQSRETLYSLMEECPNTEKLLDINLRKHCYNKDIINKSLGFADILKLNEDELAYLVELLNLSGAQTSDFCNQLMEKFSLKTCVVTMGSKGAFAMNTKNESVMVPGMKVDVVDTIGSGDSFTAGFVKSYLEGSSLEKSCSYANLLGALNSQEQGAMKTLNIDQICQQYS